MKESANVSMTHRQVNSCECENGKKKTVPLCLSAVSHINQAGKHDLNISYHRTIWGITVWLIKAGFSMFTHCLTCAVMRWGRRSCTAGRSLLVRAERHGSGPSWQDGEGTSSSTYESSWCCRWWWCLSGSPAERADSVHQALIEWQEEQMSKPSELWWVSDLVWVKKDSKALLCLNNDPHLLFKPFEPRFLSYKSPSSENRQLSPSLACLSGIIVGTAVVKTIRPLCAGFRA